MKRKYKIAIWVIVIIAIIAALKFADNRFKQQMLNGVIIGIDINGAAPLISEEEVLALVQQGHDSLKQQKVGDIDLQMIENLIYTNPYVEQVNAFINMDATLEIKVIQRCPILRIFNRKGESYYIDQKGILLPLHHVSSIFVPVANGDIKSSFEPSKNLRIFDTIMEEQTALISIEEKLLHIANIIVEDSLLNQLIAQIFVIDHQHFELIPRLGQQRIIFGDASDAEEKLLKLSNFYTEAYREYDFSIYKAFDLRFRNQIVCIKK